MSVDIVKQVVFGVGKSGLAGVVGYQLFNADNSSAGSRTTSDISETPAGSGIYTALVTLPSSFRGYIIWSTAVNNAVYASEEINLEQYEYIDTLLSRVDVAVSSRTTSAGVLSTLNAAHGTGAWDTAGSGAHSVTITVSASGVGVAGVEITVKNTDESLVLRTDSTDSSGQVLFNLDSGTYKVILTSSVLYDTLPAQTLIVTGTTSESYSLTNAVLSGSSGPNLCRVHFFSQDIGGVLQAEAKFTFRLTAKRYVEANGTFVMVAEQLEQVTDGDGYGYVDLLISTSLTPSSDADETTYRVTCPTFRLDAVFTVPDQDSANLVDLL